MQEKIETILSSVKKNISLAPYTTFKIGGKARYFFVAKSTKDIVKALNMARGLRIPFFVLAGGSNILVSDKGFPGLVIFLKTKKYKIKKDTLYTEAGTLISTLVTETAKRGLSGFEWAGGLPGSVGGAIRGNAGAFKGEIKDNLLWVDAVNDKGAIRKLTNAQCHFSYRSSFFKKKNWIVLSAMFRFKKGSRQDIAAVAKDHIRYREEHHPLEYPNAGSIFKNCPLENFSPAFQKALCSVVKTDPFPVVPTAYLADQARLKGMRTGNAQVSFKHPNYIVNLKGAKAKDVRELIKKVKKAIKKKFSIDLEEEIEWVGRPIPLHKGKQKGISPLED